MVRSRSSKRLRLVVVALYVLATLGLVVTRHPAATVPADFTSVAAGELPGGAALVLCRHDTGGAPLDGQNEHSCCDACVIAHAPGLGAVDGSVFLIAPLGASVIGLEAGNSSIAIWRAEPSSRGPPARA